MLKASELIEKNSGIESEIAEGVKAICVKIEKKMNEPLTKRLYFPERKIPFSYSDLFSGMKYSSRSYIKLLTQELSRLGYRFHEHGNFCPNGSWHSLWYLEW